MTSDNSSDSRPCVSDAPLMAPGRERMEQTQLWQFARDFMPPAALPSVPEDGERLYNSIWQQSVEEPEKFWDAVWDFCGLVGDKGKRVLKDPDRMTGGQFFPDGKINYAENLLQRRDDFPALIFRDESGRERVLSHYDLYNAVSRWQQALRAAGVKEGDRVAGYLPNMPEAVIACLAAAALGAVWASASPDFGVQGLVDRFGQIEPKILICADGYFYGGKTFDCLEKVAQAVSQINGLEKIVVVPFAGRTQGGVHTPLFDLPEALQGRAVTQAAFLDGFDPAEIAFSRLDFNHPLFILFSSGTTGVPKCIVHGHGGTLIQHVKEHRLHCDIRAGDTMFYFTTCGWMMWNWLLSGLAAGATLLLYDGSPFHPGPGVLWDYTSKHGCRFFGTAAKYIDALKNEEIVPGETYDLDALEMIASTGSPLVHESFDYVYTAIKKDVHLASISGGTDIVSCFMLGNPLSPVWRGEIQGPGLGLAVDVYDSQGGPVAPGQGSGELVCTRPFPSMPVKFWNDPEGLRYRRAYFDRFDNVWVHGDWVERTAHGGFVIHGRSDATLNPGGVRIGTAEIYRQVEQLPDVLESVAVGQDWDGDVRVILFVVLKPDVTLGEDLAKTIRDKIRAGASPRHVPAKIIRIADIPRTKSGKITELAVRDIIAGRPVQNLEALANPESLDLYKDLPQLA